MDSYDQARSSALKELADAANQREILERRIARLKQTIASLDALIEGETPSELTQELQVVGITDAVRNALKIANSPRTAIEVRDWLANSGYDLSEQENPLASIHTILKRLVKAGEADTNTNAEGKATYRWTGGGAEAFTSALVAANYAAAMSVREAIRGIVGPPTSEVMARAAQGVLEVNRRRYSVQPRIVDDEIQKASEQKRAKARAEMEKAKKKSE